MSDNNEINKTYHADSKRAAKNTLMLYGRMFITMFIGLYTSRLVLQILGVSDYGLQNVVGGVISLFTFINGTLSDGTQRFLSFAIGKGDVAEAKKIFSATLSIHVLIALLICILTEVVGIYLIHNKMTIPEGRMDAALWVFHLSILSLFIGLSQVPFNASITSHEKMGAFAFLSIFDVVAKLIVLFIVKIIDGDKLIWLSSLNFFIGMTSLIISRTICIRWFEEARFHFGWDKKIYKEIFNFSAWNLMGSLAWTGSNSGINVLLNVFYGTVVNAARGIAGQVSGWTTKFVGGFQSALHPQIIKCYAAGQIEEMWSTAKNSALYSSYLILLIAIPVWLEVEPILDIWLGQVPEHTVFFARVVIIQTFIQSISRPFVAIVHATGKMKWPNLLSGSVLLLIVPVSYLFMKLGVSVETIFVINVIPWICEHGFNIFFTRRYTGVPSWEILTIVFRKALTILLFTVSITYIVQLQMNPGWQRVIVVFATSSILNFAIMYSWGIDKNTRNKLLNFIKRKLHKA